MDYIRLTPSLKTAGSTSMGRGSLHYRVGNIVGRVKKL